jgi:hypothetical protein
MPDQITRYDARALALIDYALNHGFLADLVQADQRRTRRGVERAPKTKCVQSSKETESSRSLNHRRMYASRPGWS